MAKIRETALNSERKYSKTKITQDNSKYTEKLLVSYIKLLYPFTIC